MIRRISAGVGTVIRWSPTQRVVVSRGSVRMSCLTPVSNAVEASEDQHRPIRSGGLPPRHGLQLLQDLVEVGPEVAQNVVCVARCPVVRMKPGRGAADQHRVRQQPLQPRRRREHLLPIRRRPGGGALGQVHSSVAGKQGARDGLSKRPAGQRSYVRGRRLVLPASLPSPMVKGSPEATPPKTSR